MQNEQKFFDFKIRDFIKEILLALFISMAFFLVSLAGQSSSQWGVILLISLGYGLPIFLMIRLSYYLVGKLILDHKMNMLISFITSFLGLSLGTTLGQIFRAQVTNKNFNFTQMPLIILIGSFISLMFIYKNKSKTQEMENKELEQINQKIQEKRNKKFLTTIITSVGNIQKIIPISEITHFKSIDHYTYAYSTNGEYIVDCSLKNLIEQLDPTQFIQIHRNIIVSIEQIVSIENGDQWFLKTKNGEELKVSRNSRKKLKEALG